MGSDREMRVFSGRSYFVVGKKIEIFHISYPTETFLSQIVFSLFDTSVSKGFPGRAGLTQTCQSIGIPRETTRLVLLDDSLQSFSFTRAVSWPCNGRRHRSLVQWHHSSHRDARDRSCIHWNQRSNPERETRLSEDRATRIKNVKSSCVNHLRIVRDEVRTDWYLWS